MIAVYSRVPRRQAEVLKASCPQVLLRYRLEISTPSLASATFGWSEQVTRSAHIPGVGKSTPSPDGRANKITSQRMQKQRGVKN